VRVYGGISRELRKGTPDRLVQTEDVDHFACTPLVERRAFQGGTVDLAACLSNYYRSPRFNHDRDCSVGSVDMALFRTSRTHSSRLDADAKPLHSPCTHRRIDTL